MKKFLTILALVVIFVFSATGCSCSGETILSFNNSFFSSELDVEPSVNYTETTVYSVDYADNYQGNFTKNLSFGKNVFDFEYSEGTYTSTLTSILKEASSLGSDISAKATYKLTSNFSIKVKYSIKGGEWVEKTDTIESEVYFCSRGESYAPIYSSVKSVNTLFNEGDNDVTVNVLTVENNVKYNKDYFVMNKKVTIDDKTPTVTKETVDYEYKTMIDNAQFLFAVRNIDVDKESSFKLPVLQFSYNQPITLKIYNESITNKNVSIEKNGVNCEGALSVNNYRFNVDSSDTAGMYQYLSVQNGSIENLSDTSLVCSYAQPLITANTMSYLGSLIYTLKTVTISNN